ncbi:MAG: hypothetical protein QM729_09825 [Solirubrobacterales bacterium]
MAKETLEILLGFVVHGLLIALPAVAVVLLVMRRGLKSVPLLIGVGLLASGAASYAAFWAYYGAEGIGATWDFLILGGSLLAIGFCWREGGLDGEVLHKLATPLALWVFGSAFIVFFGFLHGGAHNPLPMSAYRFSGELPSDNDIPRYFIEWFATHGHQHPPEYPGEWLFSDRPPLQVGYGLAQRGFFNTASGLHYQLIAVLENCLWIPAMWAVLVAVPLGKLTRSLAMLAAMISDIAIVHGFFVWPKLIAAAFLLAALAVILSPDWQRDRRDLRVAGLIGALLALSMLSHGSSVFGVVPLVIFAVFRGVPNWRWLAVALAGLLLFYVPWSVYQKYADPPGNRLLKWQLGGETEVNSEGTLEAIENGYKGEGFSGAVDLKEENFEEMVGWPRTKDEWNAAITGLEEGKPGVAIAKVRWDRFFSLFPFLGIALLGPIAMLIAWLTKKKREPEGWRDPDEWHFSLLCFAFFALACVTWGLLLFGTPEARTTIHVGSLAVPLLGLVGCVVGMRSVYPRLGIALVVVNVLFVLALYAPSLEPPEPGTSYSVLNGLLALGGLGGIVWVLFRGPAPPTWAAAGWSRGSASGAAGPSVLPGERVTMLREAGIAALRRQVDKYLLPRPAQGGTRLSLAEGAIVVVALLAIATVLGLLRLGSMGYEKVWAEDGPIYLQEALGQSFFHALFKPYAGYLVFGPRLIASFAALFPIGAAATLVGTVSALVAAVSGVAVWFGSAGHVRNNWLRGTLALATALAATAGQETLDSAAYAPWFMLVGSFWLLFLRPRTWWGAWAAGIFLLLTGLSTPGVWFFAPVALLRAFSLGKERRAIPILAGWAVGGIAQIPVILAQEQSSPLWSHHIWTAFLQRVVDGGILGQRLGGALWEGAGWTFLVLLCLAVAVGLYFGLRRGPASARWFVAIALPTSFLMFVVESYQRAVGADIYWAPGIYGGTSSRYVLVPAMIFLSAVVVTVDGAFRDRAATSGVGGGGVWWRRNWPVATTVAVMLIAVAVSFDMSQGARSGPTWHEGLRQAADKCVAEGEGIAAIPATPEPWGVQVPCSEVESFASAAIRDRAR